MTETSANPISEAAHTTQATFNVKVAIVLLSILGAGLFLYVTRHGALLTSPDSVTYITAARTRLDGQDFLARWGTPETERPPLFALFIAGLTLVTGAPRNDPTILDSL